MTSYVRSAAAKQAWSTSATGLPSLPDFGNAAILEAYRESGMRVSLGIVTRATRTSTSHGDNQTFLSSMPVELADRIRASTMGYAWPTEDVMAAFKTDLR